MNLYGYSKSGFSLPVDLRRSIHAKLIFQKLLIERLSASSSDDSTFSRSVREAIPSSNWS
jgi:hypothetical protein